MLVGLNGAVETVGSIGYLYLTKYSLIRELVEIAIDGTQADIRYYLDYLIVHVLGCGVGLCMLGIFSYSLKLSGISSFQLIGSSLSVSVL